jgi:hypothetical protein
VGRNSRNIRHTLLDISTGVELKLELAKIDLNKFLKGKLLQFICHYGNKTRWRGRWEGRGE